VTCLKAKRGAQDFVQMLTEHMASSPSPSRINADLFAGEDSPRRMTMTLPDLVVLCSPFLRAKETAEIVCEAVNTARNTLLADAKLEDITPIEHFDLRERFFGDLNGKSDERYADVWAEDLKDPDHHEFGVER
jgi:broad specificity phosphatase PhoE